MNIPLGNYYLTLQFDGKRYFPVTYWSRECLASGARQGCVMAARVTSPATETDTTSMPPTNHMRRPNIRSRAKDRLIRASNFK